MLVKFALLIFVFVCKCGFPNSVTYSAAVQIIDKREGEVCDKGNDGLLWHCAPLGKCANSYFSSDKRRKCRPSGGNTIVCCPLDTDNNFEEVSSGGVSPDPSLTFKPWRPPQSNFPSKPSSNYPSYSNVNLNKITTKPMIHPHNDEIGGKWRISEKKCKEYGGAVFQESSVKPLSIFSMSTENSEKDDTCKMSNIPLIVGGENASSGEFPHQALLGYKKPPKKGKSGGLEWKCGGSLISEKYILTAAHCSEKPDNKIVKAMLGDINYKEESVDSDRQVVDVTKVISHDGYKIGHPLNDIALALLARPVIFDAYVRPACLHWSNFRFTSNHNKGSENAVMATGWGSFTNTGQPMSVILQKVKLSIIGKEKCSESWNVLPGGVNDEKMVCAGDLEQEKGTCSGDSGGPLQILLKDPYCMYSVVGVTSYGFRNKCGHLLPAVYTRVSHYIPWIESIVWPGEQ